MKTVIQLAWAGVVGAAAWAAPAGVLAQSTTPEAQTLRAEIAALRQDYEARLQQLERRLEQLEVVASAPPSGAAATTATSPGVATSVDPYAASSSAVATGDAVPPDVAALPASGGRKTSFNPAMSVILSGTYANLSRDPEDYSIAGFFPGGDEVGPGDRGFSLGESEITLSANVDPYFTAALTAALTGDGEIEVEEAFARTTALPAGLTVKGGRFFSGIGYLNEVHAHAWDFVDQPLAYQAFFGGQLAQDGVQVKWLAPTDLFLEFGAEAGNGDAHPGTNDGGNGLGSYALFAHVGGDLGDSIGWRAGLSWLDADATERSYEDANALDATVVNAFTGQSRTWIADATLKWSPGGDARRRSLELQAEYMRREEDGQLAYDVKGEALDGSFSSRQDAWYAQAVYRFAPRWRVGLRYDALDSGDPRIGLVRDGTLTPEDFPLLAPATPSRVTVMADWSPSEFSRLRMQYAWDDARDTGSSDEQWLLQYIYAIGAHGAHKF
ncbi:MAG TPA: hypothetical protein VNS57_05145 [Steroidobacteraceae bacterium]|nr:hypothetical protein [Steroidobacteraceae bacterium]